MRLFKVIVCAAALMSSPLARADGAAGSVAAARASAEGQLRQSSGLGATELRAALSQREAQLARMEEQGLAKEKTLFAAFALSASALGKLTPQRFWEIAPAPAPLLRAKEAGAFADGSTMRFSPQQDGAPIVLLFEGLSANACRALAERALDQALDASGVSDPFRRHALMRIDFGRQPLESLSFRQARQILAPPEGLARQWLAAEPGPASEAALKILEGKRWDPCAQLLPGEALALSFREKASR